MFIFLDTAFDVQAARELAKGKTPTWMDPQTEWLTFLHTTDTVTRFTDPNRPIIFITLKSSQLLIDGVEQVREALESGRQIKVVVLNPTETEQIRVKHE